jgi:hypothetical protein
LRKFLFLSFEQFTDFLVLKKKGSSAMDQKSREELARKLEQALREADQTPDKAMRDRLLALARDLNQQLKEAQ